MPEPHSVLMAMPANNKRLKLQRSPDRLKKRIMKEISKLPIKAAIKWEQIPKNGKVNGIIVAKATKNAAPLLMPNKPGSANGFLHNGAGDSQCTADQYRQKHSR